MAAAAEAAGSEVLGTVRGRGVAAEWWQAE